ncbi:VOC family protein [Solibacillus sp. MA9]|uniref:VOC family protein n=1 Tax=Solibacillus palustris TaxID=2908203 RepID=A0ABS9UAM8_9BACL|nr:VOC family protein [Solibacillus sp. MA9]MCH7321387.1 VOC family protein [Solibacillus sp. MA9]
MYLFDHVVHFVEKPEFAVECLQNEGIHTVMGGKHEMWGTYNALSYFDLSYIECIGIFDEALFEQAASEKYSLHASFANRRQVGLKRFAIRTTTIEQDAKKFTEAGLEVYGPTHYSRTREDGSVVRWQLLYVGYPKSTIEFPFFIQWDEYDEQRRSLLTEHGVLATHQSGDLQLAELHFVVPNFVAVTQMATLCEATVVKHTKIEDNVQSMTVRLPNIELVFHCPTGVGRVWNYMLDHGYGIQKLVLTGAKVSETIEYDGATYEMTTR